MNVALILIPIFVLVGLWLIVYSRRRSAMVKAFAEKNGLLCREKDNGSLERELNSRFALPAPFGRNFSDVRTIAEGEGIRLFRTTEALDLSRYGMPQNTHAGRIAVLFEAKWDGGLFFLARDWQDTRVILPQDNQRVLSGPAASKLIQIIRVLPPPHLLSVTIMNGYALVYLEPVVTGGEKGRDLEYLFGFAREVKRIL